MIDPDEASVPPLDPEEAQRREQKSGVVGDTLETLEGAGYAIDAALLVVQAGGLALGAGATTLKAVAAGTQAVGDLVAGIADL